jgi:hypothetical protein
MSVDSGEAQVKVEASEMKIRKVLHRGHSLLQFTIRHDSRDDGMQKLGNSPEV